MGASAITGRARWVGRGLVIVGAVTLVASAVVGYLWLHRMPELQPVEFGQQVQVSAGESTSATIFASTGLSRPPSCEVTSDDGNPVAVGEPEGYHQGDGLESAYEFPVASGTTYTVSCDSAETGRFDVAQESAPPQGVFIGAGSLGLVLCGVGAILTSGRAVRLLRPPSGADEAGPVVPKG